MEPPWVLQEAMYPEEWPTTRQVFNLSAWYT